MKIPWKYHEKTMIVCVFMTRETQVFHEFSQILNGDHEISHDLGFIDFSWPLSHSYITNITLAMFRSLEIP